MRPCALSVLVILLTAVASEEDVPDWAKKAEAFAVNVSVGLLMPDSFFEHIDKDPEEVGASAFFALDSDKEYLNYEETYSQGMGTLQQIVLAALPPPGKDAGVESKDDMLKMMGLTGKETLTLKARLTKKHFSLAIVLGNAKDVPFFKDGKTLCIKEDIEEAGSDVADAFENLPDGFGLHSKEPDPAGDEKHVEKEIRDAMPEDMTAAEKELMDGVKKDVKKGGDDEIDGDDTYTVDVDDLAKQLKGTVKEVPKDFKPPFTVEVFSNKTTGLPTNVLMVGTEDGEVAGARLWVNFTKIIFEGVPTAEEPVCKDGQKFDEALEALMPPPERRLMERAMKLRALEAVNGALSVVRTLRPHNRVPKDATQLWNIRELEAAKMERYLVERLHSERAASIQLQRKSQTMLAGAGLLLAVMGAALFRTRCQRKWLTPGFFEPLPRSDTEIA